MSGELYRKPLFVDAIELIIAVEFAYVNSVILVAALVHDKPVIFANYCALEKF